MVDGSLAPRQESCGTFPVQFRKSTRRKLSTSQQSLKSDAILEWIWKPIKISSKDKDIPQTLSVLRRDRPPKADGDNDGYEREFAWPITESVEANEPAWVTICKSF